MLNLDLQNPDPDTMSMEVKTTDSEGRSEKGRTTGKTRELTQRKPFYTQKGPLEGTTGVLRSQRNLKTSEDAKGSHETCSHKEIW